MREEWLAAIRERVRRFEAGDWRAVVEPGALREVARLLAATPDFDQDFELLEASASLLRARAIATTDDPVETDFHAMLGFLYPLYQADRTDMDAEVWGLFVVTPITDERRWAWIAGAIRHAAQYDVETRQAFAALPRIAGNPVDDDQGLHRLAPKWRASTRRARLWQEEVLRLRKLTSSVVRHSDVVGVESHATLVPVPSPRYLVGDMPSRAPAGADVSVVVRILAEQARGLGRWERIDGLDVPASGAQVVVLVQPPPELTPLTPLEQLLHVPHKGDSDPVRFGFRAGAAGLHRVRVLAFAGGTALAELELEVSVEAGGPYAEGQPVSAAVDDVRARDGEVTLQVRNDAQGTVFQLLSDRYLFEPVLAQSAIGDATPEIERAVATLKQLAQGRAPYSGAMPAKWMREQGVGLWTGLVPEAIKEQFWQLHGQITSFTVATSHDAIPWELLYPLAPGHDNGFLVEQFPVLRRVFGQHRSRTLALGPCTCVVSARPPVNSAEEIARVKALLGDGGLVADLGRLLEVIESGGCSSLHFACHNTFSRETGSSIDLAGGPFVPSLLNTATVRRSLAERSPMVFLNACRTAGSVPEYTRMTGWAQQFMASGAGAFVGTLWPVRSDSASRFAEVFYQYLRDGQSLGRAATSARQMTAEDSGLDPTWLAYTVYGDPHARAA